MSSSQAGNFSTITTSDGSGVLHRKCDRCHSLSSTGVVLKWYNIYNDKILLLCEKCAKEIEP
jgi:hypothetical protein